MTVSGFGWLYLPRRSVIGNLDDGAHPRMYAALKAAYADWCVRTSRRRTFFSCTRRNENDRSKIQALGSWNRVTGNAIKVVNKSATKICYASECMHLAAAILDECRAANV